MKTIPIKLFLLPLLLAIVELSNAQTLYISNGGNIFLSGNAKLTVLNGNVQAVGNGSITGIGTLEMAGTVAATLDMQGNPVPNLEIANSGNVSLLSNVKVTEGGTFTNGKLALGAFDVILDSDALAFTGGATSKFFETNGTGQVKKELTGAIANYDFPLGAGTDYRPLRLNTTAGTYTSAVVGVQNKGVASALKPISTTDHLNTNWPITQSGISGATVAAEGTYLNSDIVGTTETNIKGYYHNGTSWSSVGEGSDDVNNKVSAPITAAAGVLTGINKFVLANAKAYLAGAFTYDGLGLLATTVMRDDLRLRNVIPSTSPYQNLAPYSGDAEFTKANNSVVETILNPGNATTPGTVFGVTGDNAILDWVFLELRNVLTPTTTSLAATRSALIQRDGDIVDVDGISPVLFNTPANGTYVLGVKHRNHHPIYTDLVTNLPSFNETPSALVDMGSRIDAEVFGTPGTANTSSYKITSGKNLMWGGNANGDNQIRYLNSGNELLPILQSLGGNPIAILPSSVTFGYYREDINFNGQVRYINSGNEPLTLLQILGGNPLAIRVRQKPL